MATCEVIAQIYSHLEGWLVCMITYLVVSIKSKIFKVKYWFFEGLDIGK